MDTGKARSDSSVAILSLLPGVAHNVTETVTGLGLGVGMYINSHKESNIDNDFSLNQMDSSFMNLIVIYGITKGILQIFEGAVIAKGKEQNSQMGIVQMFGGLTAALAGFLYECIGTSMFPYVLGLLAVNSLVRVFTLRNREKFDDCNKAGSTLGDAERYYGMWANTIEAMGFVASLVFNSQSLLKCGLFARGIISIGSTAQKIYLAGIESMSSRSP